MNEEENQNFNEPGKLNNDEPNRLDDLEKRLYRRDDDFIDAREPKDFHNFENNTQDLENDTPESVKRFWPSYKTKSGRKIMPTISTDLKLKFLKQAFWVSFVIFIAALGVFAYVLFGNKNTVSAKNVVIDVVAPTEISGGDEVDMYVNIQNQNNTKILDADLVIDFPEGTVINDENGNPVKRWRENLGDIDVGEKLTRKFSPLFFGEEGERKSAKISVEYRISGSNALVSKDVSYDFLVKSAPVSVTVTGPAEVSPNSSATYEITVKSKSLKPINNVALLVNYSFGFEPESFNPSPSFGSDFWELGNLNPEGEQTIKITGKFSGFEGDQKIISVMVGSGKNSDTGELQTLFLEKQVAINLTAPFIATSFTVNGSYAEEPVIDPNGSIRVDFIMKNNLSEQLEDVEVKLKIYGGLHSESSIAPENGFYRSLDEIILWNQQTRSDLATVPAGESRKMTVSFRLKDGVSLGTNTKFTIDGTVSGLKNRSGFGLERVSFSDQHTIKLASALKAYSESLYNEGPFSGTGFLPPKVDQETYYTIHFHVGDSSNDLRDVVMKANLPVYVKWLGEFAPFGAEIKYSPLDNNIVWEAGNISAGESKDLYFRVLLVPSLSQVGRTVVIVRSISGEGVDDFSGARQTFTNSDITTKASDVSVSEGVVSN